MTDIGLIGAGAIGCTFAAAAKQAGHTIHVASRSPISRFDVTWTNGHFEGSVSNVTTGEIKKLPIVMLAVKAHQTIAAKPWLDAMCGPGTVLAKLIEAVLTAERGALPL